MPLFWKPYTSDVTAFIDGLKKARPSLEDEQLQGRNRLWDRRIDGAAEQEFAEGDVPQQPYVYQTRQR